MPMDKYAAIMAAAHGGAYGHNNTAIPTMAQAVAGNYRMGRCRINGIAIAIEQPQGSYREGTDPDGKQWRTRLAAHYGYLPGTKGADGDPLDCFIGPWPESDLVWVINQIDPSSQRFDEHKIMLCFQTEEAARTAYLQSYDRDWRGLGSMVQATTEQLKWWLKFGKHTAALTAKALPFDGNNDMSQTVWDSAGNPVGNDLAGIIYNLRRDDAGGLLLDAVSVADILEDADAVLALDALVVPYNKLQRKMEQLQAVMNIAGDAVKPLAMQLTQPFKQRGTTNVAAIFELSDGQTVSVYFHNPDTTPNKLTPDDEMVSWRWLLNKKDVTIVVAPEKGTDLNVREVARRIMRLADKNSAKFQAANTTRASRLQAIEGMKQEIEAKTAELNALDDEIATLTEAKAAAEAAKPAPAAGGSDAPAPSTSPVATLLWSEGSRDENRDFASLDDLEAWFKQTFPESQLKSGSYSKNKIRLMLPGQPVSEHRIDVASNAGDFNPHRESLVSYLKEMGVHVPEVAPAAEATKPAPDGGEKGLFERKWPLSVQEAKDQGLIESFYSTGLQATKWRVGIDNRVFNTGGDALDFYFQVVKPRDDAMAMQDIADDDQEALRLLVEGKAFVFVKNHKADEVQFVTPESKEIQKTNMRTWRSSVVWDLENKFGRDLAVSSVKVLEKAIELLAGKPTPAAGGSDAPTRPTPAAADAGGIAKVDDRAFLQDTADGKVDFYDKAVTERLKGIASRDDGSLSDLVAKAKTAAKEFLIAEFKKKVS